MTLRLSAAAVSAVFLALLAAGLLFTLLPAFGLATGLSADNVRSWQESWRLFFTWPGISTTLAATVISGIGATVISLMIVILFTAATADSRWFARIVALQTPLLAVPHAAIAIGFAFLIAPSGWLLRLISPGLTGFDLPPDVILINDRYGFALMAGLIIKEVPFLLLVTFAALSQTKQAELSRLAGSFGYHPVRGWLLTVFPSVYRQIRLPVLIVLAYSLSVVDMALILGPNRPGTLAVETLRWFSDPDLSLRPLGAVASLMQVALIAGAIVLWLIIERLVAVAGRRIATGGGRAAGPLPAIIGRTGMIGAGVLAAGALFVLLIWTFARRWRFPDSLPASYSLRTWQRAEALTEPAYNTLILGLAAVALCTLACLLLLERYRTGRAPVWLIAALYLPLLLPQAAFIFALKIIAARFNADALFLTVLAGHALFVLPYLFLALRKPHQALDPRLSQVAASLGKSPWQQFIRVRLPLLKRPLLIALALGFAVSVTQYLPTLVLGAGRWPTLTTEAVALAAGGDRRILAVTALLQAAMPLLAFIAALIFARDRRRSAEIMP